MIAVNEVGSKRSRYNDFMMHVNQLFTGLALLAPLALALVAPPVASDAQASTRTDLCTNTRACAYAPIDEVPTLDAEVCWDGETVTLMVGDCGSNARPYTLRSGEVVDAVTLEVAAYAGLLDTCELGYCVVDKIDPGALGDGVACCDPRTGDCTEPDANGNCPVGDITWCKQLETNGDGTVTCHE